MHAVLGQMCAPFKHPKPPKMHQPQPPQSKKGCKDQESIQSRTTTDTGYQWESNKPTVRHHKRVSRSQPFPSR